jgi:hypothetical protein
VDYLYPGRIGDIPFVNPLYTMPLYKKFWEREGSRMRLFYQSSSLSL